MVDRRGTQRRFLSNCVGRQAAGCGLVEILEIKPPLAVCFRTLQNSNGGKRKAGVRLVRSFRRKTLLYYEITNEMAVHRFPSPPFHISSTRLPIPNLGPRDIVTLRDKFYAVCGAFCRKSSEEPDLSRPRRSLDYSRIRNHHYGICSYKAPYIVTFRELSGSSRTSLQGSSIRKSRVSSWEKNHLNIGREWQSPIILLDIAEGKVTPLQGLSSWRRAKDDDTASRRVHPPLSVTCAS
jgi:hypothetical protein